MSDRPNIYRDNPDALSSILSRLQLHAEVYVSGDFCGAWAVDTSGSQRLPFHLISRGEAWLHMDNQPPKQLAPGHLIILPHDSPHIISNAEEIAEEIIINQPTAPSPGPRTHLICGFYAFNNEFAYPLIKSLPELILLDVGDLSDTPGLRGLIELMINELKQQAPGHYALINQIAYLLFIQVIRQQVQSNSLNTGLLSALFEPKIGQALSLIHNRYSEHWTLEKLAQESLMSRSAFAQRFHDLVGMPAMQYLTEWRMQEATHLLKSTNLSIQAIAEQCNYESEAAFRKAFKKTIGVTASSLRKQHKKIF